MRKPNRALFLTIDIILIALLVYIDQYTKQLATLYLKGKDPYVIIPDVLLLQYLEGGNKGGAFGIFYGQRVFFIVIAVVFVIAMLIALIRIPPVKKYRVLRFFLAAITAGAVGNAIDRVLEGSVVDFIYVVYINFPIFNVADIYVTVSSFALAVLILFVYKDEDLNMKKANDIKVHSSMINKDEEKDG